MSYVGNQYIKNYKAGDKSLVDLNCETAYLQDDYNAWGHIGLYYDSTNKKFGPELFSLPSGTEMYDNCLGGFFYLANPSEAYQKTTEYNYIDKSNTELKLALLNHGCTPRPVTVVAGVNNIAEGAQKKTLFSYLTATNNTDLTVKIYYGIVYYKIGTTKGSQYGIIIMDAKDTLHIVLKCYVADSDEIKVTKKYYSDINCSREITTVVDNCFKTVNYVPTVLGCIISGGGGGGGSTSAHLTVWKAGGGGGAGIGMFIIDITKDVYVNLGTCGHPDTDGKDSWISYFIPSEVTLDNAFILGGGSRGKKNTEEGKGGSGGVATGPRSGRLNNSIYCKKLLQGKSGGNLKTSGTDRERLEVLTFNQLSSYILTQTSGGKSGDNYGGGGGASIGPGGNGGYSSSTQEEADGDNGWFGAGGGGGECSFAFGKGGPGGNGTLVLFY